MNNPDIGHLLSRIEDNKRRHLTHLTDALTGMLLCSSAHTLTQGGPGHGEDTLAYLIVKAVLDGELVPMAAEC